MSDFYLMSYFLKLVQTGFSKNDSLSLLNNLTQATRYFFLHYF